MRYALDKLKFAPIRFVLWILAIVDAILTTLGYKLYELTLDNLVKDSLGVKLTPEEIEEINAPAFARPFKHFADAMKNDTQMSMPSRMGELYTKKLHLRERVDIRRAIRENPDIRNTPIRRPIFIIGLPRTGTTLLHRLLAQDPQLLAPMLWELRQPTPPGRPDNWRECQRYLEVKALMGILGLFDLSAIDAAHWIYADEVEECTFSLRRQFLDTYTLLRTKALSESTFNDWYYGLSHEEMVEIYREYKDTLQCIFYRGLDSCRLVLKAHIHLLRLDALLTVFPDAQLVYTHRPLTSCVPSLCGLGRNVWAYYANGQVDAEYGSRVERCIATLVNRSVPIMQRFHHDATPFYHVYYEDLVMDPMEQIRKLYAHCKISISGAAAANMRRYLADNPQHKRGKHKYSMAEFGLSEETLEDATRPYLDYMTSQTHHNLL